MVEQTYPRSLYEARLDAKFYAIFHGRNARFFRHLKGLFSVVTLTAGTAAVTLLLRENATVAAVAGVSLATVAILDKVVGAAEQAFRHEASCARYHELLADNERAALPLAEFEARLYALGGAPSGYNILSLRSLAYNDNLIAAGRIDYLIKLSLWERMVAALA